MAGRRIRKHDASKAKKAAHPYYVKVTCSHCGKELFARKGLTVTCQVCKGTTNLKRGDK